MKITDKDNENNIIKYEAKKLLWVPYYELFWQVIMPLFFDVTLLYPSWEVVLIVTYFLCFNYFVKRRFRYVYEFYFDDKNEQIILYYFTIIEKRKSATIPYHRLRYKYTVYFPNPIIIIRLYVDKKNIFKLRYELRDDFFSSEQINEIYKKLKTKLQ